MTRTVSVALCTYNSGEYIEAQLRSILDQGLPVHEVVVGDDGSSDGTVDRIRAIAADHPRGGVVRIAFEERAGGVVPNFARTLAACEGEFIALSDHDDVWRADKTSTLVPMLEAATEPALVFTDARLIDGEGNPTGRSLFEAYGVTDDELAPYAEGRGLERFVRRNIVTGATVMFTRDVLDAALPIPPRFVHDEWLAALAAAMGTVIPVREQLIDYRIHGSNQIGVPPATLWGQARIALQGTRERYVALAERAADLRERLASTGARDEVLELLDAKRAFEDSRARQPRFWPARYPGIARRYEAGDYARFTHRPSLERWRDLVQRMS